MPLTSVIDVFLVGTLGGVLLELVHWWNLRRRNPRFPKYAKSVSYWAITLLIALGGGVLAVVYFGDKAEAIVALHVGISTPVILQKLSTSMAQPGARSLDQTGLNDFFTW